MPEPSTSGEQGKEECAWCKWMKAGACRESFEAWQACVDGVMGEELDPSARKEAVDKCSNVTQPLFECMMRHRDYYASQLEGMGVPPPSSSSGGGSGSGSGDSAPPRSGGSGGSGEAASSKAGSTQVRVSVGGSSGQEAATAAAPS